MRRSPRATSSAAAGSPFAAGIATGEAIVAGGVVLAGDVLEAAMRMEQAAAGGEVLVDGSVRRAAAGALELEPAGPGAWRLAGIRAAAEAISRSLDTPLVGREHELEQLLQAFERAHHERACHLCTVLGTSGIGKSRLADEFAKVVSGRATVLAARCHASGEGGPLGPLRELVEAAVGADLVAGVTAALADDPDAALVAERLAAAVGLTAGQAGRDETGWALRRLVAALGRVRPVVVCLDDIHWADPSLLELVDHLVEWLHDVPVFVLCLARPELREAQPAWGSSAFSSSTLLLDPLSPDESDQLVAALAEATGLPPAVRARVTATAEGNPLFIEQLLAFVGEEDGGSPSSFLPRFAACSPLGSTRCRPRSAAPSSSRRWWDATSGRRLLQHSPNRRSAAPSARRCTRSSAASSWHRVRRLPPAPSYRFAISSSDAAYGVARKRYARSCTSASPTRRRSSTRPSVTLSPAVTSSRRTATWPSSIPATRRCRRSRDAAPKSPRGAAAGAELFRGNARAAAPLLERALALAGSDEPRRAELLVDLGEALRDLGELTRARAVLAEAIALGPAPVAAHARVLVLRIEVQSDPGISFDRVRREVRSAIEELEQAGHARALAQGWYVLAWMSFIRCHAAETERALRRSVRYAREAGSGLAARHGTHLLLGTGLFGPLPVPDAVRRCEDVLAEGPEQRIAAAAYRAPSEGCGR